MASVAASHLLKIGSVDSGDWRDVVAVLARLADAAPWARRLNLGIVVADPDRGRKNAERNPLFASRRRRRIAPRAHGTLGAFGTFLALRRLGMLGTVIAFWTVLTIIAVGPLGALRTVATRLGFWSIAILTIAVAARRGALFLSVLVAVGLAVGADCFVVAILIVAGAGTALILFFEARPAVFEDAEIMVRELEVIFGLDAVPGELRIAGQRLVFLKQLRGVPALPIVLTIAIRTARNTLGTLSTATATAAALTIVDQESCSLSHRAPQTRGCR